MGDKIVMVKSKSNNKTKVIKILDAVNLISGLATLILIIMMIAGLREVGGIKIKIGIEIPVTICFSIVFGSSLYIKNLYVSAKLEKTEIVIDEEKGCPFVPIVDEGTWRKYEIIDDKQIGKSEFCKKMSRSCHLVDHHDGKTACKIFQQNFPNEL